jgi:hypothetical protein
MTCSSSYAVFKYVKDPGRDITIPVGVALWSGDAGFAETRFVSEQEHVKGVSRTEDLPYIDLVRMKIADWRDQRKLPYQDLELSPYSDDWWRHAKKLLIHRVQISDPLPIDCEDPNAGIESLFHTIVNLETRKKNRIDSALRNALGEGLASKFSRRPIDGYKGKPVEAMRTYSGTVGDVVLEAVNLGANDAAEQADGLVGKLQRVRLNGNGLTPRPRPVAAIVGYIASPNGLNGEAYLKSWIEEGGSAKTFDMEREQLKLREATDEAIHRASYPVLE